MEEIDKIKQAADFLKKKGLSGQKLGCILGSGLGEYADTLLNSTSISYKGIPYFPVSTVEGHKGKLVFTDKLVCMQGRFHFYEGYNMEQVVFPIRVMALLGIKNLIVTNACGGVNPAFTTGQLMLIKDHINFMGTNPLIGKNLEQIGVRFPDMSEAYYEPYREMAKEKAKLLNISLTEGVYAAFTGPSYETPAEVRMAALLGADAVGMSTVPEVIAANHVGLKVLGISCVTNPAAGVSKAKLSHEEVTAAAERVKPQFLKLLDTVAAELI